jgi:outer membrane receptor protein involved in Fe transport
MNVQFRLSEFYNKYKELMKIKGTIPFIIFLILVESITVPAQGAGSISGVVTDKSNNETLIGANVLIVGTTNGASTDIDGYYQVKGLTPGLYNLRISYISYQAIVIENVEVKTGQDTKMNISLAPSSTELQEVIVTADVIQATENAVLKYQKNSLSIVDGVSAELISKNNSSDGTDVLKRMTGVTISDGKYAFVRGVGDRYNNTLLNGASIPGTDPEKKSFSYDIFPANLIENVITAKTFTPDKPADFAGGLVQISTIEFPSRFLFSVSTSGSYNTNTTGENFITYNGGGSDFFGYDDGTRDLPSSVNGTKIARGNYTDAQLVDITKSFSNNWGTHSVKAPVNGSVSFNVGNKYDIGENTFGFIGSLSYSNSAETKELERNFYDYSGSRYNYNGASYTNSVVWGGMLNLSYKIGKANKLSLKNVYNQNADDITTVYSGDYRYADQYREITALNYISRSLFSTQAIGEHNLDVFSGLNIGWNLSYSQSKRDEPDTRRYIYGRGIEDETEPMRFQLDQSLTTRYYGKLDDNNYSGNIDFNIKLFENPEMPQVKIGYLLDKKERDFDARSIGFRNVPGGNFLHEDSVLQRSVSQIFLPENITSTFIQAIEITKPSDSYTANQTINAAYLMADALLFEKLKLVAGARYENSNQVMNSFNDVNPVNVDETYEDILPAVNLTYMINDWINVRGAYSITLARPEFRELAPFVYFDFIENELVKGNPDLKRSLINNYDIRFEMFPGTGELLAVSFFYKKFNDPIEEVVQSAGNELQRSFENSSSARNYGVEIELRKNMSFIAPVLRNLSFAANASFIDSKIELQQTGFQQSERALQGQAPYIFNLGLYYDDIETGINASVVYNKVGERIDKVGSIDLGNIMQRPVDLVDLSVSKSLFEYFTLKLTLKDLLNQDEVFIQRSPIGDKVYEKEISGRNISIGLSYKL